MCVKLCCLSLTSGSSSGISFTSDMYGGVSGGGISYSGSTSSSTSGSTSGTAGGVSFSLLASSWKKRRQHHDVASLLVTFGFFTCQRCRPPVCVWRALALCALQLVSWPSLPLLSSCFPHLKPWPCSQNVPSVFLHLSLLQKTEGGV